MIMLTSRANESLFKTQFVPLNTSKMEKEEPKKNSFFQTMNDLSKISNNRTRLFESKDFGNYTLHSRSFSLYDPVNHRSRKDDTIYMDPKPGNRINLRTQRNSKGRGY